MCMTWFRAINLLDWLIENERKRHKKTILSEVMVKREAMAATAAGSNKFLGDTELSIRLDAMLRRCLSWPCSNARLCRCCAIVLPSRCYSAERCSLSLVASVGVAQRLIKSSAPIHHRCSTCDRYSDGTASPRRDDQSGRTASVRIERHDALLAGLSTPRLERSGVDIQGAYGAYPPVRKIRNFLYLISELFRTT